VGWPPQALPDISFDFPAGSTMYLDYWKLAWRPFDERIDVQCFYASGVHQGAWLQMQGLIDQKRPLGVMVGAVGIGKSMVAAKLADALPDTHPAILTRVHGVDASQVLYGILDELHHTGTAADRVPAESRAEEVADVLQRHLARRCAVGQHPVIIVDASHELPEIELIKLLRALLDLKVHGSGVATVFLTGAPELLVTIRRPVRDQELLVPQIILQAMSPPDTAGYIRHRMLRAGGDPDVFSETAVTLIHDLCGGVPRRINRLCDLCLLAAFSADCDSVTDGLVWSAQGEMGVLAASRTAAEPATRRWRPLARRLTT
jgi:general secretion pathway protein A